jgi:hypothetical protein
MPIAQPLITDIIQNLLKLPHLLYQVNPASHHLKRTLRASRPHNLEMFDLKSQRLSVVVVVVL